MHARLRWISAIPFALLACTATQQDRDDLRGVVSSATPEATAAGLRILEAGGNAIDAAVAVSLTLGVSEPAGSGIGGQVFILFWHPEHGGKVVYGSSRAPAQIPAGTKRSDLVGHRATTVPSALKVLDQAQRSFGSGEVTWAEACQPAIECAAQGFVRGHFRRRSLLRYGEQVRGVLAEDRGGRVRRPQLARTLQRIAEKGAQDFYTGELATEIVADMEAKGGWITAADLADFPEPQIVDPLVGEYRGDQILTLPPPTGGWVVLRALNVLENARAETLAKDPRAQVRWMAEALQLAHGERYEDPINDSAELGEKLDKVQVREELRKRPNGPGSGETTHFGVVDADGMVVAVTQSLNAYYGAKVFAGDMGFLYNDYMREFVDGPADHPFKLGGGKEPYSSMSASIVLRDGQPILTAGSPGSRRIISAVVQVLSNVLDRRMGVVQAVAAPRIHVVPELEQLFLERRPSDSLLVSRLEAQGFAVAIPLSGLGRERRNPYFGGVHALARGPDGQWVGAADPRRDGRAAAQR